MKLHPRTSMATIAVFGLLYVTPMPAICQQAFAPRAPEAKNEAKKKDDKPTQSMPRLVDGHPNLSGFWASGRGPDTPVGSSFGARDPGIKRGDAGNAKVQSADPNQPPYKPELLDKIKNLAQYESKYDPAFYCKPGGVPRIGPPHAILQAPGMPIVFLYQLISGNTFRLIPTDGRPHDPNADHYYYGDSVGHWDGDTLVIDTIDLNDDTWLGLYGWFHSPDIHVTERITRDGDSLHYQATVEDPTVFTKPWAMNPWTSKATKELLVESFPCTEVDEGHIIDFGEKTKVK